MSLDVGSLEQTDDDKPFLDISEMQYYPQVSAQNMEKAHRHKLWQWPYQEHLEMGKKLAADSPNTNI